MMKFGIRLPVAGPLASPSHIRRAATHAEEYGYDSIWVHDFIGWTKDMDRHHVSCGAIELITDDTQPVMFETITNLAFLAGITNRITIGSAILCTPYRNPVVQAKQLACIDALSGGRLVVGAGVGALKRIGFDFEVVGVPRADKYERTHEYVQLMREIWEQPYPSFAGQYVQMPQTEINPKPVQQPLPIWFAGRGDKAWNIMTELANGWIPTWVTADGYCEAVPRLREQLDSKGRGNEGFTIAKECYAAIATTSEEARRSSRATFETFTKGFTVKTYEEAIASALLGSPDEIIEQVADYRDAGVEHIEMKFIYHSEEHLAEQMQLFAETVMASSR
jgi:probable F420-dependent oxidoreductase